MKQFKGTQGFWDLIIDDDSEDGVITSAFRDGMLRLQWSLALTLNLVLIVNFRWSN